MIYIEILSKGKGCNDSLEKEKWLLMENMI